MCSFHIREVLATVGKDLSLRDIGPKRLFNRLNLRDLHFSTTDILSQVITCWEDRPKNCKMSSTIPGVDPLDAGSNPWLYSRDPLDPGSNSRLYSCDPLDPRSDPQLHSSDPLDPGSNPWLHSRDPLDPGSNPQLHSRDPLDPGSHPWLYSPDNQNMSQTSLTVSRGTQLSSQAKL